MDTTNPVEQSYFRALHADSPHLEDIATGELVLSYPEPAEAEIAPAELSIVEPDAPRVKVSERLKQFKQSVSDHALEDMSNGVAAIDTAKADLQEADGFKDKLKSLRRGTGFIISQTILQNSTGDVLRGAGADYTASEHKVAIAGLGAAVLATETADRLRIMLLTIPHYSTEVYKNTHSWSKAGLVGSAIYTAWNLSTSEILTQGMDKFPSAKRIAKEEFPTAVELFRDSLPGANKELVELEKEKAKEKGPLSRVGKFALRHAARGGTGISLGTTAFVATSAFDGDSVKETRQQYLGVTADTAVATFGVVSGVMWGINELRIHGLVNQANWVYNRAIDTKTWYAIAALSIVGQWWANRSLKKEIEAKNEEEVTTTPNLYLVNQNNTGYALNEGVA